MSIKYAILGILSWKPTTGYDLKKIFEDSSFLYWSGNNNQIYKALIQMQEEELVTSEVIHQDNSPSKKIYTITKEGQNELKEWVMSTPEAPEIKKSFLVQFAWSDMLNDEELSVLLDHYETEIRIQLIMQQEKNRRAQNSPNRNQRESLIWEMISENIISTYKNELNWVRETRQKLFNNAIIKEKEKMNYEIKEVDGKKYIELISTTTPLNTENDALDLIALCWEHEISQLIIPYEALSQEFFQLKTKVAGNIIQKFINYNIKVAAIIPQDITQKGRFREMALEMNKGNHFIMCENKVDAHKWLS
ncbi:MAG: putative transcriptional regulator [Anaerocolumna sp.]|jgi:DNA-binding PadR family transcriptional regulator|nr:putative transcriptional regulator [Anaerocolumna sp.]